MNGENVDFVFIYVVIECGFFLEEVKFYFLEEFIIWIDFVEVFYCIGEKGKIKILYSDRKDDSIEIVDCEV